MALDLPDTVIVVSLNALITVITAYVTKRYFEADQAERLSEFQRTQNEKLEKFKSELQKDMVRSTDRRKAQEAIVNQVEEAYLPFFEAIRLAIRYPSVYSAIGTASIPNLEALIKKTGPLIVRAESHLEKEFTDLIVGPAQSAHLMVAHLRTLISKEPINELIRHRAKKQSDELFQKADEGLTALRARIARFHKED